MRQEVVPVDINSIPGLSDLVERATTTRVPQPIQQDGETVAVLVPARQKAMPHDRRNNQLPSSPYRSLTEMVHHQPVQPPRSFTDEELKQAIADARAQAWSEATH